MTQMDGNGDSTGNNHVIAKESQSNSMSLLEELPPGFSRGDGVLNTPYGILYEPASEWAQLGWVVLAFLAAPLGGWLFSFLVDGLNENTRLFYAIPLVLVFILGYGAWIARLHAIGFELIGRGLLRILWTLLVRRRKPESIADVLPTTESITRAAVQAQKAGNSFLHVVFLPVIVAFLVCVLVGSGSLGVRLLLFPAIVIAYSWMLARMARRGYLPLPDSDAV